jgi:hypothetical protein
MPFWIIILSGSIKNKNSGLPFARFLGQNYIYKISIMKQRLIELCNGSSFPLFVEKWGATFVKIILKFIRTSELQKTVKR